ncbi:uncharacterized protein LOC116265767 isoform X2 [Nymphaea colorata]|uniref:uncharacterized protein LOC116265767 isoform X2 n=1 Tax=Nymphaea colorata TaxID=210225 RepID=UPI00129E63FF|nr:uncharacterized protein LOC116265767 isoform X2 [Nymphaea colorata]
MAAPVDDSVRPEVIEALLRSIKIVPSDAVPSIIDCVLATTGLSSSRLFASILDAFPDILKEHMLEYSTLSASNCGRILSFIGGLLHLQKLGARQKTLHSFICMAFVPVLKMINPNDFILVNQVMELLCNNASAGNNWRVVMATLTPYCLSSLKLSLESIKLADWDWSDHSIATENDLDKQQHHIKSSSGYLPIPIACHALSSMLAAATNCCQLDVISETLKLAHNSPEIISKQMLLILSNMTIEMLSQDSDMRSCAIRVLFPAILEAYDVYISVQFTLHNGKYISSRLDFCREVWECCKTLFSAGSKEKYDAYLILSLYFDSFIPKGGCKVLSTSGNGEEFDLRADQRFWEETRSGLVDSEAPTRKQALYVLKLVVSSYSNSVSKIDYDNKTFLSQSKPACQNLITTSNGGSSTTCTMTRREKWAHEEAKSLGVGLTNSSIELCCTGQQRWRAFLLLYDMLEEYGTHLVEAAWGHQIDLLLSSLGQLERCNHLVAPNAYQIQMETSEGIFLWLAVLWKRGLRHGNPQVRCLVMHSFVSVKWQNHGNCVRLVPKDFILGPLVEGLNDPVHHKDFGIKGVYSSETIKGASNFFSTLSSYFSCWEKRGFLCGLFALVTKESFGRAGLMALATCIASFACGSDTNKFWAEICGRDPVDDEVEESGQYSAAGKKLLGILQLVLEQCRHHFNPSYRLQVCDQVLASASSLVPVSELPLDLLLHFLSSFPREFTDINGSLREKICHWLYEDSMASSCNESPLLKRLCDFPEKFIANNSSHTFVTFDDEDLSVWKLEAQRWARMLFLLVAKHSHFELIFSFVRKYGLSIGQEDQCMPWNSTKFLLVFISLIEELQMYQKKLTSHTAKMGTEMKTCNDCIMMGKDFHLIGALLEKCLESFQHILEKLVLFARSASAVFWSCNMPEGGDLPGSVLGKLGGPSQRRLPTSSATSLLQAVTSLRAITSILKLYAHSEDGLVTSAVEFLWSYTWNVIALRPPVTEAGAEVQLAAHEALADVLEALAVTCLPRDVHILMMNDKPVVGESETRIILDPLVNKFLDCINKLLAIGMLARSRRAVLIHWKWCSLDSLLLIPYCIVNSGEHKEPCISNETLNRVLVDVVDSLENASESSFLPMLRSIKLVMELQSSAGAPLLNLSRIGLDTEMMWKLVKSAWTSHANCNKRRLAPIAALLSSILHPSVFGHQAMHETVDCSPGPLKWLVERILSDGAKSPRTIRLAALHLTGLWFLYPQAIMYYMRELKLLTLYGSVAFDEDFEASITENDDARREYLLLARGPDPELTESFVNTEMYARVSVAVLFYKLANLAEESEGEGANKEIVIRCGKMFLLQLLDAAVHRRKIRVWQMICILSQFVDADVVQQVTSTLHTCLYRNNLPAVRQYLENFAIKIYLKFPTKIKEQLIPILLDQSMKPQALSSYVFIAANLILHTSESSDQLSCLYQLLPPVITFLTAHHHSLRGFTQILVYRVLDKLLPACDTTVSEVVSLERRCLNAIKIYLHENADCRRLRSSMQGFLDAFDPNLAATPEGIFTSKDEDIEFECVPTSLMDQVNDFLNDARGDLRMSMANDEMTLKNEDLAVQQSDQMLSAPGHPKDKTFNFQKKATLEKMIGPNSLAEIEEEDHLYTMMLLGRNTDLLKDGRQELIVIASLLDRIPNLAGLARTCEVFKAAALAIADKSVMQDKQFQLISVTAEKWVPVLEVPVCSIKPFLEKKKRDGFCLVGLEQTANSVPLDQYSFPRKTVLVLGREKEGIPVDIIHILDACVEIPQLGVVRSLNVHVSGAIAIWEYTRQERSK